MIAKIIKVAVTTAIVTLTGSLCACLRAEDYPAGYLGNGYREYLSGRISQGYPAEVITKIDLRMKERINRRNEVETMVSASYQAATTSTNGIFAAQSEIARNFETTMKEVELQKQQREKGAAAQGVFNYLPGSDGKIVYFKDGLPHHVDNERSLDEFGNVSYRNSYNYQYDDNRLLAGFEADTKDISGNISHLRQYGMMYTADSVFYGTDDTNANKNLRGYFIEETDPAGNIKVAHVFEGNFEGKLLRSFSQTIVDSIYGESSFTRTDVNYVDNNPRRVASYHEEGIGANGLSYSSDRTDITYNDKVQTIGYHEEMIVTQVDGRKSTTTTDAKFTYIDAVPTQFGRDVEQPDPDRLFESSLITTVKNADGSTKTDTATVSYKYDGAQLVAASGYSDFNGQDANWWQYTDTAGHLLARSEDVNGNVTYSYQDPGTNQAVIVPNSQVKETLKDGNKYSGFSDTQYETSYNRPMIKQIQSQVSYYGNNINPSELLRIEDTTTTYNNVLVTYTDDHGVNFLKMQSLGYEEHTETTDPLRDPDNSHMQIRNISATNTYDARGNIADVFASGNGSGWEYSFERGWNNPYTSTITETFTVILNQPVRTDYHEDKSYINQK